MAVVKGPDHWLKIVNELAACVRGLGEIQIAYMPMAYVSLQLAGVDLFAALQRRPLKETDLCASKEELDAGVNGIFQELIELGNRFSRAEPKMAEFEWDVHNPTFWFLPREEVLSCSEKALPRMQELRRDNKLVKKRVNLIKAFMGDPSMEEVVFVSHRWEHPDRPDQKGVQLKAICEYLATHPKIKYVWFECVLCPAPPHTRWLLFRP